jgi:hypothetical protein
MQMGFTASLVALEARGASAQEICGCAEELAQIPGDILDLFARMAADHCATDNANCGTFDEAKFRTVACVLWIYFTRGVLHARARLPEGEPLVALLKQTYVTSGTSQQESGDLIARRIQHWSTNWEHVTNYCAFRCGYHAGKEVGVDNPVTVEAYRVAYSATETEMKGMMDSVRGGTGFGTGGGC